MKVNLNDEVKIKINKRGLEDLKKDHDELNSFTKGTLGVFEPPVVDKDGYVKMQLHVVMRNFGHHMSGCYSPIETEIIIDGAT